MGERLELTKVGKSYGDVCVIDGLSMEVAEGEFLVLLGPSGCGKSTLLRLVAGLEHLDSGSIRIGDDRIDTLPPGKRGVAMVFQHYALYPHMSVRDNMTFGLRNIGIDRSTIENRVQEVASSLEIENLLARKPGELSGGQRQRVAIARAIVKEPRLFLLDEPLSNLDAALRTRTRLEIARLHKRLGATTVFVTHDQVEAMTLADRIVVLNGGKIEQCDSPMEIYRRPRTKFVAQFVGSPKINILAGTLETSGECAALRLPTGESIVTGVPALAGDFAEIGLRAEKVSVAAPGSADLDAKITILERLGDRTLVHAELADGSPIVAEAPGDSSLKTGNTVGLFLDCASATVFDRDGFAHHSPGCS